MVTSEVWAQAWVGRRRTVPAGLPLFPDLIHPAPGLEILCIGCLEQRIGRTLMASDFIDAPVNNPFTPFMSECLFNRLIAKQSLVITTSRVQITEAVHDAHDKEARQVDVDERTIERIEAQQLERYQQSLADYLEGELQFMANQKRKSTPASAVPVK